MELMDVASFLNDLANYSIIVPIGIGLYYFSQIDTTLRILFWGMIVLVSQLIAFGVFQINSAFVFAYVNAALDTLIFAAFFGKMIPYPSRRKLFYISACLTLVCIPIDVLYVSKFENFGYSTLFVKLAISLSSFLTLNHLFKSNLDKEIFRHPVVWVCFGLLIENLVGSFDIFSIAIMNYSQGLVLQFYMVWAFARIIMYLFFSYAFYLSGTER